MMAVAAGVRCCTGLFSAPVACGCFCQVQYRGILVSASGICIVETEAPELKTYSRGKENHKQHHKEAQKQQCIIPTNSKSYVGGSGLWGLGNMMAMGNVSR